MRILGIGNLNRMGELFCQIFRDLGYDADYLEWHPKNYRPWEKVEPILVSGLNKELSLLNFIFKQRKKYDLFVCHYAFQSAMICNLLKLNYVCHARGYDITHSPNHWLYGGYLKNSFRNSKAMWCSTPVLLDYAKKYNKKVHFIPNMIRTDIYKPGEKTKNKNIRIFMPSRHVWRNKGIDKSLEMFKEIQKSCDAEIHFIEWGEDVERTKKLIERMNLKKVFWHKLILDQYKMAKMYNFADVVWDSFGFTEDRLNLIALEAMSCNSLPIIKKLKKNLYPGSPPIVQGIDEKDIIEKTLNFERFDSQRKKQREWIEKYFSYNAVKEKLKKCLEEIKF